jgi:pimeloyl-ACP methyl ester carboxylesterase
VIALHGITASARSWPVVARALPSDWTLLAPDLRGRGASARLPGQQGHAVADEVHGRGGPGAQAGSDQLVEVLVTG